MSTLSFYAAAIAAFAVCDVHVFCPTPAVGPNVGITKFVKPNLNYPEIPLPSPGGTH